MRVWAAVLGAGDALRRLKLFSRISIGMPQHVASSTIRFCLSMADAYKQQIAPILMVHLAGQDGAQLDSAVSAPASDSYPEYY
jgi:hypothetical protein